LGSAVGSVIESRRLGWFHGLIKICPSKDKKCAVVETPYFTLLPVDHAVKTNKQLGNLAKLDSDEYYGHGR
jgi:hypothetical protein